MALPTPESVAGRLFRAAEARTLHLGLHFQSEVSSQMQEMAGQGAKSILSSSQNKAPEIAERSVRAAVRVGSEAMAVFVDEMAVQRLIVPGYIAQYGLELNMSIWTTVRSILCPIWPIC